MRSDLILRALLPAAAVAALILDAPQAVAGCLALAALAGAAERLVRVRGIGTADRVLVGVGGVLVVMVLTGMLLGSTDLGPLHLELSPTSWVVSLAVLSLAGLAVAWVLPDPAAARPAATDDADRIDAADRVGVVPTLRLLPWLALSAVLVVSLVHTSGASLSAADAPPLQMSFGTVAGTRVQVVVSSTDRVGPLEIRTSADGNDISYPLFTVRRDGRVTTTLSLPRSGRFEITLNRPDQTTSLRTLILDR